MTNEIKELCRQRGITVDKMLKDLNLGKNSIYRWDSNTPNIKSVTQVADYLGCSLDYIMGRGIQDGGELGWIVQGINQAGLEAITEYARFVLSQPQYKKCDFSGVAEKSS